MLKDFYPVQWDGAQAVVTLPEHIGASNAGQVRNALLSVINYGAMTLIADMTATVSCDHAGADAVVRAWQRTVSSGTELRLVVTARSVSQALGLRGLDRQVSVYPSLGAAAAARLPAQAAGQAGPPPHGSEAAPVDDPAMLARPAAAHQEHLQLLDAVITGLFAVGLSLQPPRACPRTPPGSAPMRSLASSTTLSARSAAPRSTTHPPRPRRARCVRR